MIIGTVEAVLRLRDEFTGALKRAQSQLQTTGAKFEAVGAKMSRAGGSLTKAVTLPITLIGGAAVKSFASFDNSMTQSLAIMGDVSDAMRSKMADAARQMSKETTFSAVQAADSYFYLASAGLNAEQALAALPKVAKFAQAGNFDMALATDLLTDAQSALGLTIRDNTVKNMENMVRVSDVLVRANTLANATVEQFSTSLTREAGAAMKSFHIDVEEGVAVLAAFADQGVKGEIAGTGLSRILRLMTSAAVQNADAYKKFGVEVFDANGKIKNMADIVEDLENALGFLSDEQRTVALDMLGFKARVQGVILPLLGTSDAIRNYEKELRSAGGYTELVAQKQLQTFSKQLVLLKNRLVDAFITLGEAIVPSLQAFIRSALIPAIDKVKEFAEWFKALPQPMRNTIIAVAAVAAALGPLLVILGGLVSAIGAVLPAIGAVAASFLGPAGWVAAAVAVVAAWKPAREFVVEMITTIVEKMREWWNATAELRGFLVDLGSVIARHVGEAFRNLLEWLADAWDKTKLFAEAIGIMADKFLSLRPVSAFLSNFSEGIKTLWDWTSKATAAMWEWIGGFDGLISAIGTIVPGMDRAVQTVQRWVAEARAQVDQTERFSAAAVEGSLAVDAMDAATESMGFTAEATGETLAGVTEGMGQLGGAVDEVTEKMSKWEIFMAPERIGAMWFPPGTAEKLAQAAQKAHDAAIRKVTLFMQPQRIGVLWFPPGTMEEINRRIAAEANKTKPFDTWAQSFKDAIAKMIVEADNLGDAVAAIFTGRAREMFTKSLDTLTDKLSDAFKGGKLDVGKFKDAFVDSFKTAKGTAAGTLDAVSVAFAASSGNWEDMAVGAMTAIANFASGNMAGAVIAAVGVIAGAFKNLFGSDDPTHSDLVGDAFGALEQGVPTMENASRAADALAAALNDVGTEAMDLHGANELLEENFDTLYDAAKRLGGAAVDALARVVEAARASGVNMGIIEEKLEETIDEFNDTLEQRNEALVNNARELLAGIERMGIGSQRAVEFAAESVMQAFNAMLLSGMPLLDILREIESAFGLVFQKGSELGVNLPPEFERFGEMMQILSDKHLQNVIERLEGIGAAAEAAGNLGLLTAEQFDLFGDRARNAFRQLTEEGLTSEEAIAALGPQLQQLNDLAEMYGFELDKNTQKLLDQAIAQGIVTEKGLTTEDILIKGFDKMLEGLNRLIEALGGVPVAFASWDESVQETTDSSIESFNEVGMHATELADEVAMAWDETSDSVTQSMDALAESSASAADDALASWTNTAHQLPVRIRSMAEEMARDLRNIPVSFLVDGGPGDRDRSPFSAQHGSHGFVDFGVGTPAVLHGTEQVITAREGTGIAEMVANALRSATRDGGGRVGDESLLTEVRRLREELERMRQDFSNRAAARTTNNWGRS